jgi:hypothetical protein
MHLVKIYIRQETIFSFVTFIDVTNASETNSAVTVVIINYILATGTKIKWHHPVNLAFLQDD